MTSNSSQARVFLWTVPRAGSTAFTKCMSFVDGAQVWYEPYLYCYQNERLRDPAVRRKMIEKKMKTFEDKTENPQSTLKNASKGETLENNLFEYPWVKEQLEKTEVSNKDLIFVKEAAFVMHGRYEYLPDSTRKFRHSFLIRHPQKVYDSYRKMLLLSVSEGQKNTFDLLQDDVLFQSERFYKHTYELWRYVKENLDPGTIIIDGTELAAQPERLLPKYFEAVGIPYKEDYLRWDPSPDVILQWKASFESLLTAYERGAVTKAANSGHFVPESTETAEVQGKEPPDVTACVTASLPYYNLMHNERIRP